MFGCFASSDVVNLAERILGDPDGIKALQRCADVFLEHARHVVVDRCYLHLLDL